MRRLALVLTAAGLCALLAACSAGGDRHQSPAASAAQSTLSPTAPASTPPPPGAADLGTLRTSLRDAVLQVGSWTRGTGSVALFAGGPRRPWMLPVEGTRILAYPFTRLADAKRTVAGIDRNDPFPAIEFKGAPHVFRFGSIVVLFVQDRTYQSPSPADARILEALRAQLGTDYAVAP
jgi:hypothetical protein